MPSSHWWRTAAIYEIYVRSFADGNGDGEGDLIGLRERLPYLRDLGVDAIWLTPFFRSPMVDGGYDVADYRDVDPLFGTLADFDAMLAAAHALDIRVIVDIVPNHTSSQHAWFTEALASPPGSLARDRYIFRPSADSLDEPPNDWESIFGGRAWTRTPDGEWYLHLFDPGQPDLNWDNADVRAEFESVLRFWLDRGVDGFRIDVAHGMIKEAGLPSVGHPQQIGLLGREPLPYFDQDGVHEIYRAWRKILDSYPGDRMAVAEAWASTPLRLARYVAPDELHQAFNFDFLAAPWSAAALRATIDACIEAADSVGAPTTWVLSNHDKARHLTRFGSPSIARAAALLMLALPGAVYLYQGEELGLPEVLDLPDDARQDPVWHRSGGTDPGRDGCRVPLPWTADAPAYGFSTTGRSWLPQPDWSSLAVSAQQGVPSSFLELYREALRLRRTFTGPLTWHPSPADVLDFQREGLRCVVNLSAAPVPVPAGSVVLSSVDLTGDLLPPDAAAWLRA
ncbi:glycoside hydrolase family 13 protein [Dactylosporangium sp. NPDC049525]|uniref:glycoside hydrolase family 13 protein n=1 Tax=Dactylosporangium sp. NPDC049525 TaxID=3154730 RepID=UPI00343FB4FE